MFVANQLNKYLNYKEHYYKANMMPLSDVFAQVFTKQCFLPPWISFSRILPLSMLRSFTYSTDLTFDIRAEADDTWLLP